jgi:histidinol-phosphatase
LYIPCVQTDLALALRMADAADEISLARYHAHDLVIESKPDLSPVTDADRAVETAVRDLLAEHRSRDAIHGEEFGRTDGDRQWIIDPIDGTKNFVRGVPVWATLIALAVDGEAVVGVVSAPAMGRRWWAQVGEGAFTRGPESPRERRIHVSAVDRLEDASFAYSDTIGWGSSTTGFTSLVESTWRQRAYGDFWSHMLVAEGAVDIAAEPALQIYDLAALLPIVGEAGGRATTFAGTSALGNGSLLTTNGRLHTYACALLGD